MSEGFKMALVILAQCAVLLIGAIALSHAGSEYNVDDYVNQYKTEKFLRKRTLIERRILSRGIIPPPW